MGDAIVNGSKLGIKGAIVFTFAVLTLIIGALKLIYGILALPFGQ